MRIQRWVSIPVLLLAFAWSCPSPADDSARASSAPQFRVLNTRMRGPRARLQRQAVALRGEADGARILSAAFAEGGESVTTIDGSGRLVRWALDPPGERRRLLDLETPLACAALSRDGTHLAYADQHGALTMLDLPTEESRWRVETSGDPTCCLAFSPGGDLLGSVTQGGVLRVHTRRGGEVEAIRGARVAAGPVQSLAFSPDAGRLAVASFASEIRLFDLGQRAEPRKIEAGEARVTALAFTSDPRQLVVAAADGTTRVVDPAGERAPIMLDSQVFAVWQFVLDTPGARLAAASWDGTIRIWDTASWDLIQSNKAHEESVSTMRFGPRSGLISAAVNGPLLYFSPDIPSIAPAAMITGRPDSVWVGVYAPGGQRFFLGGRQRRFELWDLVDHKLDWSRPGQETTRCAAFSPDGNALATGGNAGKVIVWNLTTRQREHTLLRHPGAVSAVLYTPDGHSIISGCDGGVVKVWNAQTGRETASWHEHKHQIYCARLSPDAKWLLTGGGNWTTGDPGELIVWHLESGRVHARLEGNRLAVWTIAYSPDGSRFATSNSSGEVVIWNAETFSVDRTLKHAMWIRSIAFSPDGNTLAVGRGDGSVRLWDTTDWKQTMSLEGHDGFTFFVQYSPDGATLATSGDDGTVRFWPMTPVAQPRAGGKGLAR